MAGVQAAGYDDPTERYPHGVLGDTIEFGALWMEAPDGQRTWVRLPESRVFEDLAPRVQDLDGDGQAEVIVIESSATQGARLAIYDLQGLVAATPYIGTRFRWLAPVGAADLDGDGFTEIAYVDRPHLAKTLRVWRFRDRELREVAALAGVTNHRIGEDFITGGLRDCGSGPELVLVDAAWRDVVTVALTAGALSARRIGSFTGPDAMMSALDCH